jgi:hypothetical protein
MIRRTRLLFLLAVVVLPLLRIESASAVPRAACGRANVGREASADGGRFVCKRVGTGRRARFQWVLLRLVALSPASTALPPSRGSASTTTIVRGLPGLSDEASQLCLTKGTGFWENNDAAYWQNILNQKVNGNTNALLLFESGVKRYNFLVDGRLIITTEFRMASVLDSRGPRLESLGTSYFEGRFHVEGTDIVIDAIDQDFGETTLSAGGVATPATRRANASALSVGYRMFFKCDGNRLGLQEPGLTGNAATTYTLRA